MAYTFTDKNITEVIESGQAVVVDFWATWCGPCMKLSPVVEELADKYADKVVIGKYNVEDETEFATAHRIMSIPTVLFFKGGEQVRDLRLTGATREQLEANIEKLMAL